jgi:hypothetical protein
LSNRSRAAGAAEVVFASGPDAELRQLPVFDEIFYGTFFDLPETAGTARIFVRSASPGKCWRTRDSADRRIFLGDI